MQHYPDNIMPEINAETLQLVNESRPRQVAEIGCHVGTMSVEIVKRMVSGSVLHLFDFDDKVQQAAVAARQAAPAGVKVLAYGNSYRTLDSYNWPLFMLWGQFRRPVFNYVMLDGAHTFAVDGLTYFLADMLLMPGGIMDFDDYHWRPSESKALNPEVFPEIAEMYTDEQIGAFQVKLIVDNLLRHTGRYSEILGADLQHRRFKKEY